jgi:UDP-N-acetyl-D-glucosamine dehydrogenase
MKVAIIGQGYVGLTIAAFASKHHQVVGFDNNSVNVDRLNQGLSHIEGVPSSDLAAAIKDGNYLATTQINDLSDAEIVVIAVPTPLTLDRKPDLSFIESACKTIGLALKKPALIINESTSFPGTLRDHIKPLIEKYSEKKLEHLYAISPERVDPGRTDWNQKNTPRLFAGLTQEASDQTREFYSTFCDNLVEVSSPEVAEAAKLFENTFRQVNIALVNEFAEIAHALGISVHETLDAANTKPYGFMKFNPSAGVGGHCIPVDPLYLTWWARQNGEVAKIVETADLINYEMPIYVGQRALAMLDPKVPNPKVLIIGVAYKPGVGDVRETPVSRLRDYLMAQGATVTWHDPLVTIWENTLPVDLESECDVVILATRQHGLEVERLANRGLLILDCTNSLMNILGVTPL